MSSSFVNDALISRLIWQQENPSKKDFVRGIGVRELKDICRRFNIKGCSNDRKARLLERVLNELLGGDRPMANTSPPSPKLEYILLPCGGQFPKPGFETAIRNWTPAPTVHAIHGPQGGLRQAGEIIHLSNTNTRFVLIGWSAGGATAVRLLDMFGSNEIAGMVLLGAATQKRIMRDPLNIPILQIHHKDDQVIDVSFADSLYRSMDGARNKNHKKIIQTQKDGGNNHQYDNAVGVALNWLKKTFHTQSKKRVAPTNTNTIWSDNLSLRDLNKVSAVLDNSGHLFASFKFDTQKGKYRITTEKNEPKYKAPKTSWKDVNCTQVHIPYVNYLTIKTPCDKRDGRPYTGSNPSKYKVFVQGHRNFAHYCHAVTHGRGYAEDHEQLMNILFSRLDMVREVTNNPNIQLINHNRDVPILHFKFQ